METRDIVAIPVLSLLGIVLGVLHETSSWNDNVTLVVMTISGSIACGALWHFDWSRFARRSERARHP